MSSVVPPSRSRLEFTQDGVLMGPHRIPIGRVLFFNIQKSHTITLLGTETMGLKLCKLDFHLETPEKVEQFVHELFKKTEAYFLHVQKLKTTFEDETGQGSVNLTFLDERAAKKFFTYAAPFYFHDYKATLNEGDYSVTVTSKPGNKEEIIKSMNHALRAFNLHSDDSLNDELLENENPDFPGVLTEKPQENLSALIAENKREGGHFIITFKNASKVYSENPLVVRSLEFTKKKAQEAFNKMQVSEQVMGAWVQKPESEKFRARALLLLKAVSSLLAQGVPKNPVEMRVFKNLLGRYVASFYTFNNDFLSVLTASIEQLKLKNPLSEEEKRA